MHKQRSKRERKIDCPWCDRKVSLSAKGYIVTHNGDSGRRCLAAGVFMPAAVAQAEFVRNLNP